MGWRRKVEGAELQRQGEYTTACKQMFDYFNVLFILLYFISTLRYYACTTPSDEAVSFLQSVRMGAKSRSERVGHVDAILLGLQAGVSAHPGPARVLRSGERRRSLSLHHGACLDKVRPVQDGALHAPLVNAKQTGQALLQLPVPLLTRLLLKDGDKLMRVTH